MNLTDEQEERIRAAARELGCALDEVHDATFEVEVEKVHASKIEDAGARFVHVIVVRAIPRVLTLS